MRLATEFARACVLSLFSPWDGEDLWEPPEVPKQKV